MSIQCFWCEETHRVARYLRRYADRRSASGLTPEQFEEKQRRIPECPTPSNGAYHDAMTRIEDGVVETGRYLSAERAIDFLNDSRWPTKCACGYEFAVGDERQVFVDRIYRRTDTGATFPFRERVPGAMWHAWWWADRAKPEAEAKALGPDHFQLRKHPDGIVLSVQTPDGEWCVDQISSQGNFWTRTGDPRAIPPTIVARPSIICGKYHGWLGGPSGNSPGKLTPA